MKSIISDVRKRDPAKSAAVKVILLVSAALCVYGPLAGSSIAGETDTFKWGFDERIRQTYIENGFDLWDDASDDWNFIRVRTRLWCQWKPAGGVILDAGLNNEHRHWFKSTRGYEDDDFEINELVFEKLCLSINDILGYPVSIIAGRQNIMYGEGFLFMDGGPLDGSRTGYFNAVRMRVEKDKRSFELHLLSDPSWDKYLPTLNCQRQPLIEYDETGAGIYYTDQSLEKHKIEGYYFYKNEKDEDGLVPESDIHTIGGRLSGKTGGCFSYASEWAFQLGGYGNADRKGFGGYLHGTFLSDSRMNPSLTVGVIYLSGDDPETEDYEGWDPLYSRWPKWSELYIYTLATTGKGVAYWENLFAPNIKLTLKPLEDMTAEASLYYMNSPEDPPADGRDLPGLGPVFGEGRVRGFLSAVKISYKMNKNISGHLLWERFDPGDYYNEGTDTANFLRWELFYNF
ncbi:MAG: alginate export family protein [Candidatus Krumholzibacteriota bacterium]|nr:alginate export family protein [Candidatus Krumholzibacteriota bacterium]